VKHTNNKKMADTNKRISVLGIGLMGKPMCKQLLNNGYFVVAWNRTKSRAEALKDLSPNVQVTNTAKEAFLATNVSIMMLWDAAAVETTLAELSPDEQKGRIFVNMTTISPDESRSFEKKLSAAGGTWIEAPVLGNSTVAEKGCLQILVGCEEKLFDSFKPMFSCFGIPRYVGPVGAASATKLANNFILGANLAAFAESYSYLERSGVKMDTFMTILTSGPMNFGYFGIWAEKFKNRNYDSIAFTADGIDKDVSLAKQDMQAKGVHTGAIDGIYKLIHDAVVHNQVGAKDFTAIYEAANPKS